jgi:alkaline phosphatase
MICNLELLLYKRHLKLSNCYRKYSILFGFLICPQTYCVDKQVADSACSATAYLCGVKANYGTLGVNARVKYNDCAASNDTNNYVNSIAQWFIDAGKAAGIVTTTRVTHASPAGTYSHVGNRDWESDTDINEKVQKKGACVPDIATQLVRFSPGKDFKVILGGGRRKFLPKESIDEEGKPGHRSDKVNLITEWKRSKKGQAAYISNRQQLYSLNFTQTDHLLGLFESDHMQYNLDANPDTEPTLAELTAAAIRMLKNEKKGYFLFVEGGRIDHAHHDAKARKSLDETVEFSKAVQAAVELTDNKETLIVVTADHSHTMTISGYSNRGADILGMNTEKSDVDGGAYPTLSYANGPGYKVPVGSKRYNISQDDLSEYLIFFDFGQC